jgi:hypothetical protein
MTEGKKPGVPFWATVVIVVALLYAVSLGPACWWLSKPTPMFGAAIVENCAPAIYWPIGWVAWKFPGALRSGVDWYATAGIKSVNIPTDYRGARYHQSQRRKIRRHFWGFAEFKSQPVGLSR